MCRRKRMLSEGRFGVSRTRRVRKHPRALSLTRRYSVRVQSVDSPCLVRKKSVARPSDTHGSPYLVRREALRSPVLMWTLRRPQSAASPPPRTNATRTNTRRTPHRTRPNAERTTDEHRRARSTPLSTPQTVYRPCVARWLCAVIPFQICMWTKKRCP